MGYQDVLNQLPHLRDNLPHLNLLQAKVDPIPIVWTGLRRGRLRYSAKTYQELLRVRPVRNWVHRRVVAGAASQRSGERVGVDEEAGGRGFRAGEYECAWHGVVREEALPLAQQDRTDEQHDLVRKPVFE